MPSGIWLPTFSPKLPLMGSVPSTGEICGRERVRERVEALRGRGVVPHQHLRAVGAVDEGRGGEEVLARRVRDEVRHGEVARAEAERARALHRVHDVTFPRHGLRAESGGRRQRGGERAGERLRRDVDEAAGEAAGLVRREGLQRDDVLEEARREEVELDGAAVGVGRREDGAVELRVGVAVAEAADEHVLPALHARAGDALHGVGGVGGAALRDRLGRDRVADGGRLLAVFEERRVVVPNRLGLDDDFAAAFEFERLLGEGEVELRRLPGVHGDAGDALGVVPEVGEDDVVGASRDARDAVVAVEPGGGAEAGAIDEDVDADERLARVAVHDDAGDGAGLGVGGRDRNEEEEKPEPTRRSGGA